MQSRKWLASMGLLCFTLLIAGCDRQQSSPQAESSLPRRTIDPTTAATLSGTVKFSGTAPNPIAIDMSADPACNGQNIAQTIAVNKGNLKDVFVYVKEGLGSGGWTFYPPQVEIVQRGCKYVPHVVGMMAGQTFRIVNADDAMHNIHPMPRNNREWNVSQMQHAEPLVKKFDNPELMIPIKCNQHPWMKMYVNVVTNPFFAVTGDDGRFELKGLPPGTYTVAAIHETLGERTIQVTLGLRDNRTLPPFIFALQNSAAAAK